MDIDKAETMPGTGKALTSGSAASSEIRKQQKREWYESHKEISKKRALDRYYAQHEVNKIAARDKARAKKAELESLRAEVATLKAKIEA
jgi:polyhydroxyalkanoate synthesis regulator phasin